MVKTIERTKGGLIEAPSRLRLRKLYDAAELWSIAL